MEGRAAAVKLLLEKGSDLRARNKYGGTALSFGLLNDKAETVGTLLEHGADIKKDSSFAFGWRDTAMARVLLGHGVSVNEKSLTGWTPLMYAVGGGHRDVVVFLIEHGADVNVVTDRGVTALSIASEPGPFGRDGKMIKILKKAGAKE